MDHLLYIIIYIFIISLILLFILSLVVYFDLNPLIFIIDVIILLNVLFVLSYYLYNLFKNPIFSYILGIFVMLFIYLFITLLISDPIRLEGPDLESLQNMLLVEKTNFDSKLTTLKTKVEHATNFFESFTSKVVFNMDPNRLIHIDLRPKEGITYSEFHAAKQQLNGMAEEVSSDAKFLLHKINKLNSIDWQIHFIKGNCYSDEHYKDLSSEIAKYTNKNWYIYGNPDRIEYKSSL